MGGVLGMSSLAVSLLFILPLPAAFFGAWFAGRSDKPFVSVMWYAVNSCLLAGVMMWIPGWLGIMNLWTLIVPASLFFFGAGMLFPLATTGAMEPWPYMAGTAGALVGGLQNLGSGLTAWLSAMLPQNGQFSLGMLMFTTALLILLCWLPLSKDPNRTGLKRQRPGFIARPARWITKYTDADFRLSGRDNESTGCGEWCAICRGSAAFHWWPYCHCA